MKIFKKNRSKCFSLIFLTVLLVNKEGTSRQRTHAAYFSKCYTLTAFLDALLKSGVMQRRPTLDLKASNLQKACKTKYLVYRINYNHDIRAYNA